MSLASDICKVVGHDRSYDYFKGQRMQWFICLRCNRSGKSRGGNPEHIDWDDVEIKILAPVA